MPTLAQALNEAADLRRRLEQLGEWVRASIRHQEGEEPAEDPRARLDEAEQVAVRLREVTAAINHTNTATIVDGQSLTRRLAHREMLKHLHSMYTQTAHAASGGRLGLNFRTMRSELRTITVIPVTELRDRADDVARQIRELDDVIRRADWTTDLIE